MPPFRVVQYNLMFFTLSTFESFRFMQPFDSATEKFIAIAAYHYLFKIS